MYFSHGTYKEQLYEYLLWLNYPIYLNENNQ